MAGFGLQFQRAGQGRERHRHAGERAFVRTAAFPGGFSSLLRLDALPQALDGLRRVLALVTEHMRMPADELLGDALHHVAEIEGALFLRHAGMENDLQQKIAELLAQIGKIAARDGVGNLVGLLQRIGRDGRKILRQIPGTAGLRRTQRRHDVEEPADVAGRGHRKILLEPRT